MTSSATSPDGCPLIEKALRYLREGKLDKLQQQIQRLEEHYGPVGAVEKMREAGFPAVLDATAHYAYVCGDCSSARKILDIVRATFGFNPVPVAA